MNEIMMSERQNTALIETTSAREVAETQAMMIIAKKFPRDTTKAIERIKNACQRQGLAEKSVYQYARGGTDIQGPSIRLAEAIAQNYGNLQFGIREIEQRDEESTVEAFCWDIETNTKEIKTFQVPHVRYSREKGLTKLKDPRDIYEAVANQGARRLRACILGVIPGDIVEEAVIECNKTLETNLKLTPEKIKSMVQKFEVLGVTKEMLEKRIQRKIDSISPAQVVSLGNIYNSLMDKISKAEDWFEKSSKFEDKKTEPIPQATQQQQAPIEKPAEETKQSLTLSSEKPDRFSKILDGSPVTPLNAQEYLKGKMKIKVGHFDDLPTVNPVIAKQISDNPKDFINQVLNHIQGNK